MNEVRRSTASKPIQNGQANSDRHINFSRLAQAGITAGDRFLLRRLASHEPNQMHKLTQIRNYSQP